MKHSIALKIFALAVGIIALTVVVAITTNIEVIGLGVDVATVARKTIPLAAKAADLNEAGLFRRVAFERLYREYGEPQPDAETIQQATENFEKNTTLVYDLVKQIRDDLKVLPDDPEARELAAQTREVVSQIESAFTSTTDLARSTLAARKAGDRPKAKELLGFTFKGQAELRTLRSKLQEITAQMAEVSAHSAERRKNRVLISSAATTLLAVVLGLGAAWVISRNMAKPVLELLRTTRAVQGGNLNAHVGKLPEDEIGQLGDSFNAMVDELKRKENLQKAIGSYIDPRIVEKVILPGRPEDVAGQKRVMTVLFTDLVGFTTLGENLTPGGLVNVINRYFTLMSECVREEHGIIDKFIGDAIMAYWGPPFVSEEEQAAAACRAALKQVEALARFRAELPELMGLRKNLPEINLRIGLATGEVIVGNIGSETARSYTVMGDVVNLASRLESANNVYGTRILISEETGRMASQIVETREVDSIAVKGKTDPVQVYELLSLQGKLSPEMDKRRIRFAEGLEAYRKQAWPAAEMIFQELVEKYADAPARAFLERVKILRQHPPGAGWDGVWRMTGK
ncbi:adenylate/guanylate cyclase domain-containing protein [bacterium]|nr:adenylate/guanylate cyclase domain-containing protein [bacterium]